MKSGGPASELTGIPVLAVHAGLADAVYDALRPAITGGQLPPGFRLRELHLSKHFGVSTTPIREALRRLEREGLVEVHRNRGAVVAAYNPQEVRDLYEAREVLESHAVRHAAQATPRDLRRLEQILAEAESILAAPDIARYFELDVQFHRALNELGGNAQIAELAERVHRQIQAVRVRCAVELPERPKVSHAQHQAIVAAVGRGDGDRAEALLREHIASVRDAVVRVLRGAPVEGAA